MNFFNERRKIGAIFEGEAEVEGFGVRHAVELLVRTRSKLRFLFDGLADQVRANAGQTERPKSVSS